MEILNQQIDEKIALAKSRGILSPNLYEEALENLYSVYPFNEFEYVINHLIADGIISTDEYIEIREAYHERNKYLYIFEITAPRTFGEKWAQRHLNEIIPELKRPSKKYDSNYSGQYDFWYEGIKIEVKASRAVNKNSDETLIKKALSSNSMHGFNMNFQQIKPACCDVFVWIGVWKDVIRYWVLSSEEVNRSQHYSTGQHRGNTGEGQLWVTENNILDFKKYEVSVRDIFIAIKEKANK